MVAMTRMHAAGSFPDRDEAAPLADAAALQPLAAWNDTAVIYPAAGLALHQLFERQAARTPAQAALVFEQQRLSYAELNRRANQLAHHLQWLGAGADTPVGLFVERSLEMVVGMLGILKAGAAYVPIDAAYPPERIAFMIEDAGIGLLLTQNSLLPGIPAVAAPVVCLDSFGWSNAGIAPPGPDAVAPGNLAYVIYTSGSTGRPKGVAIEHRNIVNYVLGIAERLKLRPGMNHATVSTIAADLGNTVIFPALATGGCLHVISRARSENPALLAEYFQRARIDVLKIVPSHLMALQSGPHPEQVMPKSCLILGGEPSRLEWIEQLRSLAPDCEIHNHYGPTETTVGVLTYRVAGPLPKTQSGTLPLGRPLPNSRIYLLDEQGQPVPVGVAGELCIGGQGVARGYLRRAELTAEKFVPDPFSPEPGGRLYRSGDLARYLPDGNIEFCGRIDQQVKIHGYRIEPGEIEAALRAQGGVRDALVVAREDESGDKQLVAYVVPKRHDQPLWDGNALHVLPDGSPVAHLNRNETDYIHNEIFVLQAYLRHGITIDDGDCIVDAGANIGLFTVFASRLARNLRVISFEPNPAAFACLKANAAAWGNAAKCLPMGLSRENKSAELTFFEGLSLLSGFYADAATEREVVKNYVLNQQDEVTNDDATLETAIGELIDDRLQARTVPAQLRTLSSVIADEGIDRIDLLKINVEKSELDVLLGIAADDWPKIRQLVIEVDRRDNLEPITRLLELYGFELLVEQDPLLKKTELCYVYAIRPTAERHLIRQQPGEAHRRALPAADAEILTPVTLRNHLKQHLPGYMMPAAFVLMEKLPLTANGKIDRNALPSWSHASKPPPAMDSAVMPRTETEKALAAIWAEVLKVDSIGVDDDFFDLGGQSLMAIKLVSRIRDALSVDVQTRTLFDHPTIAGLAKILADAHRADAVDLQRIAPRKAGEPCALSFGQEQLWFLQRLAPDSPAYNIVDVIRIEGRYDSAAMWRALNALVARHEILRTRFRGDGDRPLQMVAPKLEVELAEYDLGVLPDRARQRQWLHLVRSQSRQPFDLSALPLFRAMTIHMSPHEHRLLLTIHHIIADEWSMDLIQREIHQCYAAFADGRESPLAALPIQYADFSRWQREWLQGEVLQQQISYWKEQLAGASTILEMPTDKPRPAVQSFRGATEGFAIDQDLSERLKALGRNEQATLFMVLEAAFMALLQRYTGQDDILVGTPITGRRQKETEALIGYFLNTIVLRARFADQPTFRALLQQVRQRALGAYAHAELPFNHLVAELAPERVPGRTPFFQAMFILHDTGGLSQVSKLSHQRELETGTAKFDLSMIVAENDGRLEGAIEYSTDLFEAATIRRLCGHYVRLLEACASDADQRVSRLPLLTDAERRNLLENWNPPVQADQAGDSDLPQLIEAQAARTPDRVAVAFEQQALHYGELNRRANQLARYLRDQGVGPDVLVGIYLERSVDMVVGLLAILKSGGAYVPLDPSYPRKRLAGIMEDAAATIVLTQESLRGSLFVQHARLVSIDGMWQDVARYDDSNLRGENAPDDLAYVIFTSGSTGRPKGVAVTRRALVNLLDSMGQAPGLTESDVLLSVTTLSFDIAALELYLPLIKGARVTLASRDECLDGRRLMARLSSAGTTVMQATPATWRMMIDSGWSGTPRLKVLCGGEALTRDLAEQLLQRAGEVWNLYGPTETTVWSSAWRVEPDATAISIGRPIANTQLWVLDAHLEPVPVGVIGELCIGGTGLARGYWQRPDLTAERFVPDRLSGVAGARLYRTGDWARWLPDGRLECLGRMDQQVKIRGFRIEPGEIEAAMARHPAVRAAVVVARKDAGGDQRLVAYLVADRPPPDLADQLRTRIRAALPEYMVPSAFVMLDALPLTYNGKIDRQALPAPAPAAPTPTAAEPQTATEEMILGIFRDVLGRTDVGVQDSFFDLGGHSIMAARVIARLQDAASINVPLRNLFEKPTVAGLATIVDGLAWLARTPDYNTSNREEIKL